MYQSMLNYLFELERTGKKNVEKTETPVKETVVIVPRTNSGCTPTKNCDTCRSCFRDIRYNKDLPYIYRECRYGTNRIPVKALDSCDRWEERRTED